MDSRLNIGHLILIFALAALPFAATFALYYPDERHYTDGALGMLKDHEWLAPKTGNGVPRFEKPPLTYWAVAASYAAFGVGVATSRLPFLLAGCGTLWLVFRLARRLTGDDRTALLAAIVLLAQPEFFLCSIRSMPDAPLVFFTTLAAFGFLRLIVLEEFTAGAFWMAYGGTALAVLSKGVPGAAIVVFAWAFAIWKERDWRAAKKLIHLPSLAFAIILVGGWLALTCWNHGAAAWHTLFGDQVTGNILPSENSSVQNHWWSPFWRAPTFALVLVFNCLPWSATAIELVARKKSVAAENVPPLAGKFILGWAAVLVLGFATGTNVSLRYLLPAAPLLAILIAAWLRDVEQMKLIFSMRRMLAAVLSVLVLADAALLAIDSQWPLPPGLPVVICGMLLFAIAALGFGVWRKKKIPATEGLGLAMLLGVLMVVFAITLFVPDRARQIVAALQSETAVGPVLLVSDVRLAARVRVLLGKNWTVTQADRLNPADMKNFTRILISEKDAGLFLHGGWKIERIASGFKMLPWPEIWTAFKARRLPDALARHAEKTYFATHE